MTDKMTAEQAFDELVLRHFNIIGSDKQRGRELLDIIGEALTAPRLQELTARVLSFPESNGKRNWTAMIVRKEKWGGLVGNCGGVTIARGELWNRVAYQAECARLLLGERETQPDILDYGADIETPEQWAGEVRGGYPIKDRAMLTAAPAPYDGFASPQFVELTRLRQKSAGDDAELAALRERVKVLEELESAVREFVEIKEVFRDFDGDRRGLAENLADAEEAMISALASLRGGSDE